jgi:hypothetical protein
MTALGCVLLFAVAVVVKAEVRVLHNSYRRNYDTTTKLPKLQYGHAKDFTFGRFQSPSAIDDAISTCRGHSSSAFKYYKSNDGREGYYSTTRLGGDWVLAESKQIAKHCTPTDVLAAYLDGMNQKKWNVDKVQDIKIYPIPHQPGMYKQEMVLKPQRILTGKTTVMRYTQIIRVDKIGTFGYNAYVKLDNTAKSNTHQRPFNELCVNVSIEQVGTNVHIYAAGIMRVNRSIVPNLIIFDASTIAGGLAGKSTLWLSKHFDVRLSTTTAMGKK